MVHVTPKQPLAAAQGTLRPPSYGTRYTKTPQRRYRLNQVILTMVHGIVEHPNYGTRYTRPTQLGYAVHQIILATVQTTLGYPHYGTGYNREKQRREGGLGGKGVITLRHYLCLSKPKLCVCDPENQAVTSRHIQSTRVTPSSVCRPRHTGYTTVA